MFTLVDAGQLFLAVLACGVVIGLPGAVLARLFRPTIGADQPFAPVVLGLAVLPAVDSLTTRFLGLDAALILTLLLAAASFIVARPSRFHRVSIATVVAIAVWACVVAVEWIDIDVGGRLFQSLTVIDTVKHAAVTQAILDSGSPPRDPFFLRSQHVSYYYFFYILPALAERLCAGFIDARAAVGGAVFWTGLGLYGLVRVTMEQAGLARPSRRLDALTLLILLASGLDIIGVIGIRLTWNLWLAEPMSWNEKVPNFLESLLWVPHHVTGLIAAMVGMMALSDAAASGGAGETTTHRVAGVALAAACFVSTVGLSVWVTLALVTTVAIWCCVLLVERRWRAFGIVVVACVVAIVLALPQIADMRAGRSLGGPSPIAATVRVFMPIEGIFSDWRAVLLLRFVLLPVNYFAGFGVLASGAILFLRRREPVTEFGRLLAIAAVAGLLLGAFLKSTLFNNDLGWRVMLFPLLAGAAWTITALDRLVEARGQSWRAIPFFPLVLTAIGWTTSLYALTSLRAYPSISNDARLSYISADAEIERDRRLAYIWADAALPRGAVLQHNPSRRRAFAFALYGRHPTAVSDSFGSLFGADPKAVEARVRALIPLFQTAMSAANVRATAMANGIDDLVVTADDPIWSMPDAFVWHVKPIYASARVRIIPMAAIVEGADAVSTFAPRRASQSADPTKRG